MATGTLDRAGLLSLVEQRIHSARQGGGDVSPTELYNELKEGHPEVGAMSLRQFSAGVVRPVKQQLNKKDGSSVPTVGERSSRRQVGRPRKNVSNGQDRSGGEDHQAPALDAAAPRMDLDGLHLALFDLASEFIHTSGMPEKVEKLNNLGAYVERIQSLMTAA